MEFCLRKLMVGMLFSAALAVWHPAATAQTMPALTAYKVT